ncbi:conserved hypothetical protein [Ricinus communis]|uniref:Uncharacterized protein n=1 Tax=Ricinus communis TaxID=3988 RepID=B9S135_RICCO|nr:conserved hypothetical protein [Ricinus communis]
MECCRVTMVFTIYIMVLLALVVFGTSAAVEDLGGVAPAPMESSGMALGVPAAVAVIASLAACELNAGNK